MSRTD